jgi:uncharacterized protein YbbC (DUF1343 family)
MVRRGVDRILEDSVFFPQAFSTGSRIGFVTSDGAPVSRGPQGRRTAREALIEAGCPLSLLFAPEHGLAANAADGAAVDDGQDRVTGLPVVSLYGPRLMPRIQEVADLDLVLFDLQDVGARFYTFLWTLSHVMEACAEAGTPLWVLDRPNPLGGLEEWVEGPLPDPDAPSGFLGRWPVPIRHSLTLGELALLMRAEMGLELALDVVAMEGWRRRDLLPGTGLEWHPPSPGLPTFASALLYPGMALLEATNVLEGRGTPLAFQWLGAPWMDPALGAVELNSIGIPGIRAHVHDLLSDGTSCPGIRLEVTDATTLRPVEMGLRLLTLLRTLWPSEFDWAPYPTVANPAGEDHLYRLLSSRTLVALLVGEPRRVQDARFEAWTRPEGWWERAEPHLLYR